MLFLVPESVFKTVEDKVIAPLQQVHATQVVEVSSMSSELEALIARYNALVSAVGASL